MAILFELLTEFGEDRSAAISFWNSFAGESWKLRNGIVIECPLLEQDVLCKDGIWWCIITPAGVSATGGDCKIHNLSDRIEFTIQLYESLRKRERFRFALVGWEIWDSISIEGLLKPGEEVPPGIVVSREVWSRLPSKVGYVDFGNDTLWRPPTEGEFAEIARLFEARETGGK